MKTDSRISLRRVYSYFIGGKGKSVSGLGVRDVHYSLSGVTRQSSIDGDYEYGQMYVQAFEQYYEIYASPILMWHGGGMTGSVWESTAHGEPGWLDFFLRKGYSVYLSDSVARGRSGFDPSALIDDSPLYRTKQEAWHLFRIGPQKGYSSSPEKRQPFSNSQFPSKFFDTYCRNFVARFETCKEQTMADYQSFVEEQYNGVIIAHSQGAGFALKVATISPESIRAVVAVEPSGAPELTEDTDFDLLTNTPHLIVWGDGIKNHHIWRQYRQSVDRYVNELKEKGGRVDVISLPDMGITGNSHCPMSDLNSEMIAQIIADWLEEIVLKI